MYHVSVENLKSAPWTPISLYKLDLDSAYTKELGFEVQELQDNVDRLSLGRILFWDKY